MDLNIVRLRIPLTAVAEQLLTAALAADRARIERSLPSLSGRVLSCDPELVRRHQKPGLPFVFSRPQHGMMECLLLGPAIAELPRILATVAELAAITRFQFFQAYDYQGQTVELSADGGDILPVLSLAELLDMATPRYAACQQVRVTLQTPLRLVADGRELVRFEPFKFVRGVLRRVSSLVAYYGTGSDPEMFIRLADLAGRLRMTEVKLLPVCRGQRGVSGSFTLQGPADELGPLLEVAGLLHLGKGAAFGLGAFRVGPLS